MKYLLKSACPRPQASAWRKPAGLGLLLCLVSTLLPAQSSSPEHPVPILTGNAGFFTNVEAGHTELVPEINPLLLIPLGDRWLIESRAEFEGEFQRPKGGGPYGGKVGNELDYLQVDYIASRYVTITAGRFLTPFGIYNERLYPIWIRDLQPLPLIFPIATGPSDGLMLRGGFSVNPKINLNYAAYFSTQSNLHKLESDRLVGGRVGFFLPGPRIELGFSWQKLLQEERKNSVGFHFAWQPTSLPLNLRSEYARSDNGSGYWLEAAYRLSQVGTWNKVMRRTEVVGRAQQFFVGPNTADVAEEYGLPEVNTRQADFGLNYYLHDGLKATASYGRQFSADGNSNLWTVGIAYRFAFPLGRAQ
ncbi:MAG: hypothetical protein LAO03_12710 [Acidobacteriia bacterium]|nr:hypothetical protein [Terriglobia bacterium]